MQQYLVKSVSGVMPEYNVSNDDIYLKKDGNVINVYSARPIKSKDYTSTAVIAPDQILGPLDETSVNVGYNQDFGIKGKTSALKGAKQGKTEDSFTVGDKVMTKSELLKLGYTEAQIQQAVKLGTIKTK